MGAGGWYSWRKDRDCADEDQGENTMSGAAAAPKKKVDTILGRSGTGEQGEHFT